jgi:hypothetical protein
MRWGAFALKITGLVVASLDIRADARGIVVRDDSSIR